MLRWVALVKLWFIKALEYRTELLVWMALTLFNTIIMITIWLSIFQGSSSIRGVELNQVIQFFLLATIINGVTASHFEGWRSREVREGKIDYYLTKPMSYPLQVFLADVGNRLFYICLIIPMTLIVYFVCAYFLKTTPLMLGIGTLAIFFAFLVVGYFIEFSFAMIAVLLSFWFEGAEGLEHFKWIGISLFSGSMIPVSLMPTWLQQVTNLSPLKYMYAVPIQVIQQQRTVEISDVISIAVFLITLYLIQLWLWKRAMRKYSSAGG